MTDLMVIYYLNQWCLQVAAVIFRDIRLIVHEIVGRVYSIQSYRLKIEITDRLYIGCLKLAFQ
jgi:hypothetical protein